MALNYSNNFINNFSLYYDNVRPVVYVYGDQVFTSFGMPIVSISEGALDKSGLKQAFRKGSLIKAKTMHTLISSSLNPVNSGSQALKMTSGSLNFASGSSSTYKWNKIAPPFVPNLHHYVKVYNFDPYTVNTHTRVRLGHPDSLNAGEFGDAGVGSNNASFTTIWECNSGSLLTFKHNDTHFKFGCASLETGGTAETQNSIQTPRTGNVAAITCTKDCQWWFKSRFKLPTVGNCNLFVGLFAGNAYVDSWADQANLNQGNRIGFWKEDNDAEMKPISLKFGAGTNLQTGNVINMANEQIEEVGIHWDGKKLDFYHTSASSNWDHLNNTEYATQMVKHTTIDSEIPSQSAMRPTFYFQQGSSAEKKEVLIEHIQLAIISGSISG